MRTTLLAMLALAAPAFAAGPATPGLSSRALAVLETHCHKCHGASKREGGLRLDRRDEALNGGDSGPAFISGKSAESRLIKYVAGVDSDELMPPEGDKLTDEQIGLLRGWIDQGADWPADAPNRNGPKSVTFADRTTGSQLRR